MLSSSRHYLDDVSRRNVLIIRDQSRGHCHLVFKPNQKQHYLSTIATTSGDEEPQEGQSQQQQPPPPPPRKRFEELGLHPKSLKALHRHGVYKLTEIQDKTYDSIYEGKDVVGRARTGTGKTLAFLLPTLERIINNPNRNEGIQVLIVSPTRELAVQLGKETERLVQQHQSSSGMTSQVIYGGSYKQDDIEEFQRNDNSPTILVATPGRLKDHLASTRLPDGTLFIDQVQNLQTLVLDEMDRLLDMGFRKDIQDILSCLPPMSSKRQTLLFSATLPSETRLLSDMVDIAVKPNHEFIDCIQDEDPATHTNAKTNQTHIILPSDEFWKSTFEILSRLIDDIMQKSDGSNNNTKIIVFFPMTSLVRLYTDLFNYKFGNEKYIFELHSKMFQRHRITVSKKFRNASKGILFTSDVSARGIDYPDVTHVIQIGAADSRETYIHRLGRTGRAGKKGKGVMILPQLESSFLRDLKGLDIPHDDELFQSISISNNDEGNIDEMIKNIENYNGKDEMEPDIENLVNDAYQAMIGYYYQRYKNSGNTTKSEIVPTINSLVDDLGLTDLPVIDQDRAEKIGCDTLPGLNIQHNYWNHRQRKSSSYDYSSYDDDGDDYGWSGRGAKGRSSSDINKKNKKPFGKPYGDFDGKFSSSSRRPQQRHRHHSDDDGDFNRRRNRRPRRGDNIRDAWTTRRNRSSSWDEDESHQRERIPRKGPYPRMSPDRGDRRRRHSQSRGESDLTSRDQFVKVGWQQEVDFKALRRKGSRKEGSPPPKKRSGAFKRWESSGDFNFKTR